MQTSIFQNDVQDVEFALLCNALYEQQLLFLAQAKTSSAILQSRLKGLPHHVKRAAENMLTYQSPLNLDIHNGTWQSKQTAKPAKSRYDEVQTVQWFHRHAAIGLVVSVMSHEMGDIGFELDCIDRVDAEEQRYHLNKHGWFTFNGEPQSSSTQASAYHVPRPQKSNIVAACCGHRWNHKGKVMPQRLSMRELLLSMNVDWKNFTRVKK